MIFGGLISSFNPFRSGGSSGGGVGGMFKNALINTAQGIAIDLGMKLAGAITKPIGKLTGSIVHAMPKPLQTIANIGVNTLLAPATQANAGFEISDKLASKIPIVGGLWSISKMMPQPELGGRSLSEIQSATSGLYKPFSEGYREKSGYDMDFYTDMTTDLIDGKAKIHWDKWDAPEPKQITQKPQMRRQQPNYYGQTNQMLLRDDNIPTNKKHQDWFWKFHHQI